MQEFNSFITLLGQESLGKAIPVITALGGLVVMILRFMFKVINTQNMSEIEKVSMNRTQRTKMKLMDISIVVSVFWILNVVFMLIHDDMVDVLLALAFIVSLFLVMVYCVYRILHFGWCKLKKTDEKWKCSDFMEQMLFVSEYLIGAEVGKLTYYNSTQGLWKGLLVCLVAALAVSVLMVISSSFLEDGPSRVYFYSRRGKRIYIYFKLKNDILLCGDNKDIKQAKVILMDLDSFKKQNRKLIIDKPKKVNN